MKKGILILFLLLTICSKAKGQDSLVVDSSHYIQVCLILDVSGSMSGLLNQAQSQIWKLLSYINRFERDGQKTNIELAVISYGNQGYESNHHIKLVSTFNTNIDSIAEYLFQLTSSGGNEYCGYAIQTALDSLTWRKENAFKFLFIAGNEKFNQGEWSYELACENAVRDSVIVNSIYCGDYENGIKESWALAATLGKGGYSNINQDIKTEEFTTPYDSKIIYLYHDFLATFLKNYTSKPTLPDNVYILKGGEIAPAYRDLIIYKYYNNSDKDLIDDFEHQGYSLDNLPIENLPADLQKLNEQNLKRKLFQIAQKRATARAALDLYIQKIEEYQEITLGPRMKENTLDMAIEVLIYDQLKREGFVLKN